MTRWDMLNNLMMIPENRKAIGKAWPLFLFLVFHGEKNNVFTTDYKQLKENLQESPNTIKTWRNFLAQNHVVKVKKGSFSMTFILLSPYDGILTCEQDDIAKIKMSSDPATRKLLETLSSYNNMSLLPFVAELSAKLDKLEKKVK